jgi:hypothetical protein
VEIPVSSILSDSLFRLISTSRNASKCAPVPYDHSAEEMREAGRALRGSILQQEVYALYRGDESDRPYSASERHYTIEVLQPPGPEAVRRLFRPSSRNV